MPLTGEYEPSPQQWVRDQVEQYACLYTGRVSNLLQYSPTYYFRGPRDRMPHEY